jgi:uncharacterized membrane protein/protein-disulfide isomerase
MSATVRRLAIVCAVIGFAAASTSLYIHWRILMQPGYISPCDINETFSCSDAYRSQYGSLLGIPVALFGVLWFAFVLLVIAVGSRASTEVQQNIAAYLFAVSTVGLAVILYLAYAAFFVLKELCVFCLGTYAAVIGLFILSGLATSIPMTSVPRRLWRDLRLLVSTPVALLVVILFLAGAGSALALFPRTSHAVEATSAKALQQDTRSDFEQYWTSQPRQTVPVSSEGAAVLVVKFTDFQCPACSKTYFDLNPILAKYQAEMPGAVKLVSKDYPLDQSCNPRLPQTLHPSGCAAAVAVRLARQHKRDAEMEEWLYSNQQGLTPATVRQAALTIGQVQDFDAQYAKALEGVKADIALGQLLNVGSTPTFFVNGVRTNGLQPAYWDLAIRLELKRAGKLK